MLDNQNFLLFLIASIVLLITPGPAIIYIVARSVSQGTMAGLVASVGMHVGTIVHVLAAAYGVSTLLMTSATAFNVIKYLGAAYLIFLGLRSFFSKTEPVGEAKQNRKELLTIFKESVVVNTLNPKIALFFFAFLPQFVNTQSEMSVSTQITVLGLIFIAIGIISDGLFAVFAGAIGDRFKQTGANYGKYVTGTVFTGLGIVTALAKRQT